MKMKRKKLLVKLSSPCLKRIKASNFTSFNTTQKRENGDSRAVTSMQERFVSRFLYFSVVSFRVFNNLIHIFVHTVFFLCTRKATEEERYREASVPVLTSQPYYVHANLCYNAP